MKIKEITENFNRHRHSVEASVFPDSIISVNFSIKKVIQKYKNGEMSPGETLQSLEILETFIEELFHSDYFDFLKATIPNHFDKLGRDWLILENNLKTFIYQIKQRHGLREDTMDFKAQNGQLSAMSNKKTKTRKDVAKSKVENLFK